VVVYPIVLAIPVTPKNNEIRTHKNIKNFFIILPFFYITSIELKMLNW
jgi:hypothetical protein